MIPKIETNFPIPGWMNILIDGCGYIYTLNMNISIINLNVQTLILYTILKLMKQVTGKRWLVSDKPYFKEFVDQAKLAAKSSKSPNSSPPIKAFVQTRQNSSPSKKAPFLQPGRMNLRGMMDGKIFFNHWYFDCWFLGMSVSAANNPMNQAGFTPPQRYFLRVPSKNNC